jgi:ABC-type sugar transport system permease subunit
VLALATVVVAGVLLAPVYLVWRAADSSNAWSQLSDADTVRAFGNTVLLTVSVTVACVVVALPLAWLSGRTDVPLSRLWTMLLALPLAVPSFVGGFVMVSALGPGGMAQDLLEPFGVERLPSIYGFGGAWFVLGTVGRFDEGMTGGRGFIGLAAMIFGRWHPVGALLAALVFGFADSLQQKLAILQTPIPSEFLAMAPYIATIVLVAGLIGRARPPAADGKPYIKD